jgi:hypothetical protein
MSDLPTIESACPVTEVTLDTSDLEIGAVEIKSGLTGDDTRAAVDASNNLAASPSTPGTASDAADIAVDATAGGVTLLAANTDRKGAIIQNVGTANMRVTYSGNAPTPTRGHQLAPGQMLTLAMPYCPTAVVLGIREGASSTSASVSEIV